MKKGITFLITIILIFSLLVIGISKINKQSQSEEKIKVIATLFPQYDFAKQIGGDKVDVSLLLTPGTETHTYEPTPQDIINVNKADLYIYTGKYMEPWSDKIANSITSNTQVLDASKNINLINEEQFEKEHDTVDNNEEESDNSHHHEYDPHIWLNPQNAIGMVKNIEEELCNIDPQNKEYYQKNAENYIKQLTNLDNEIEITIRESQKNKIAFGGTFAYAYFIQRYNLQYVSAYDSCGENSEPSVTKVKEVIDYMKENNINVIFYQELSAGKIADTISKETGATKLVFHTIHNASQEEINNGETYISLMQKNLQNLKQALS
jgi:ABC-type metal ion transport system, periplasmic component/surface adhesin